MVFIPCDKQEETVFLLVCRYFDNFSMTLFALSEVRIFRNVRIPTTLQIPKFQNKTTACRTYN